MIERSRYISVQRST